MAPCIPAFQGASPPLDPQRILRGGPSAAASLRRRAPLGDLPLVPPIRTKLSQTWQSEGAFIYRRPAPHSIAGQLPCGAGAPWAICPAECVCAWNSRWHGNAGVPLPPLLLRRASATPELPPRKASAAISGCGCVSPRKGFLRQINKSEHERIFSRVMCHDHVSSLAAYAGGFDGGICAARRAKVNAPRFATTPSAIRTSHSRRQITRRRLAPEGS